MVILNFLVKGTRVKLFRFIPWLIILATLFAFASCMSYSASVGYVDANQTYLAFDETAMVDLKQAQLKPLSIQAGMKSYTSVYSDVTLSPRGGTKELRVAWVNLKVFKSKIHPATVDFSSIKLRVSGGSGDIDVDPSKLDVPITLRFISASDSMIVDLGPAQGWEIVLSLYAYDKDTEPKGIVVDGQFYPAVAPQK